MDNGMAVYMMMKEKEKKDRNRMELEMLDIENRLKTDAGTLYGMPKGSKKEIDLLRSIPSTRYDDLQKLRMRLTQFAEASRAWCPEGVHAEYDFIRNVFTLYNNK